MEKEIDIQESQISAAAVYAQYYTRITLGDTFVSGSSCSSIRQRPPELERHRLPRHLISITPRLLCVRLV